MKLLRWTLRIVGLLILIVAAVVAWYSWHRPGLAAYQQYLAPAAAADAPLRLRWFGVSNVLIEDGETALLIDPFFTRPEGVVPMLRNAQIEPDAEIVQTWLRKAGIEQLDAVLVSHAHFDHTMDAGPVLDAVGGQLLGSPSTLNIGRGAGIAEARLQVITPGQPQRFGRFSVTFIESRHAGATGGHPTGDIEAPLTPPAGYLDYRMGGAYSILIEHPAGSLLHHGSAGYIEDALAPYEADVVLLGITARPPLEDYLRAVVDAVGARRVIPVHWDDFTRGLDKPLRPMPAMLDMDGFFAELPMRRPALDVMTVPLLEPVAPFAGLPQQQ